MARGRGSRRPAQSRKPPLTHFLCLPLVNTSSKPQLETALERFRDHVRADVHPKAIRPVGALHCTLGVMSLSEEKLGEATQLLKTLDVYALLNHAAAESPTAWEPLDTLGSSKGNEALTVTLKGLTSMHDPSKTSILYVSPNDQTGRLLPFCIALQKEFKDKEILVKDDRPLKLHATVVNTIYAKGRQTARSTDGQSRNADSARGQGDRSVTESSGHGPNADALLKIDARNLIESHEDFVWAEDVVLDRVAICEMGAKKILNDDGRVIAEEYTEVAHVALPGR